MRPRAKFIQAALPFVGQGLLNPKSLGKSAAYSVPSDQRAQLVYFRGGSSLADLVCVSLLRDGALLRLFPIGAKSTVHIPLAVIEDLEPGSVLEVQLAAPTGAEGVIFLDIGLVEVD